MSESIAKDKIKQISPKLDDGHHDFSQNVTSSASGSILDSLKNNPYFSAGFGLVGIGALLSILRKGTGVAYTIAQKQLTVSMEITSKDKSYDWILKWMNSYLKDKSQHISVETFYKKNEQNERVNTSFSFAPSVGIHYFKYRNNWIRAERTRESAVDRNTGSQVEILKLMTLGRNINIFSSILQEARQDALNQQVGKTLIYHAGLGREWGLFGPPKNKRPFDSVTLDEGIAHKIRNDVIDFLRNSKWYNDRGVPYRRGYLLYGPPGCGKTSFITALAGSIDFDISILNLSSVTLTDDRLNVYFASLPQNSILVLEDIDAAFHRRDLVKANPTAYEGFSPLTLSGILNALDGITSSEGRIVIMTTNYVERLDPALIRPGRVDIKQYIGYATKIQMLKMFQNFYPNVSSVTANNFTQKLLSYNKNISSAQIQGYFMLYKNDPELAVKNTDDYFNKN